ncbi:MAG: hypothetical protein MUP45_02230 [Candidatus Marinimicrobia bacterium]|nr:hypothetical protein [Candidatus Neomarinimicrobiota bacterium]
MTVTKDEILGISTFLRLVEIQFAEWEKIIDHELRKRYSKEGNEVFIYFDEIPWLTSSRDILEKASEFVITRYQAGGWKVVIEVDPVKGKYFIFS